ncbi:MAG: UDP-2,3-diacylglucosamine diphosphatase [Moraxellaceae bacterium]|nr:UDP-2,3-diacylglucosamine diphosphatase [Moraxellaceae bacterium]MDZ4387289.1 UDP-2,3-diacylglucosamine diphosphatase [Moraxellaceae bacterium]
MSTTLLLSDVHLSPDLPRCTAGLLSLLQTLPEDCQAVYVLGDLFEVWIGDDQQSDYLDSLYAAFQAVTQRGVSLAFCHGNRDFLLGQDFAKRCGGRLMAEQELVNLHGHAVLLMHGDQLCTQDAPFMAFREQSRSAAWQNGMLSQPLEQRQMIANMWRMQSKQANSNKPENIMDVTPDEVVRVLQEAGCNTLLHGHTHRPGRYPVALNGSSGERIVLGDWREEEGVAVIAWANADGIRLQDYSF